MYRDFKIRISAVGFINIYLNRVLFTVKRESV